MAISIYNAQLPVVLDSTGIAFSPDSCQQTIVKDGQARPISITATDGVSTWVQTITYPDGVTTVVSRWVKQ